MTTHSVAPLVVDASTTLAWMLADERDAYAQRAADHVEDAGAIVPALWRWEVQNILLTAMRRKRITEDQLFEARALLAALPITIDTQDIFGAEMSLARQFQLTIYDAAYLELALRVGCKLATHDRMLARAARAHGSFFA